MTTTDNMMNALLFVIGLNIIMFFVGYGITDVGGSNPFNYEDNVLKEFNIGNSTDFDVPATPSDYLPGGEGTSVSPDTGLAFTDIFTSIKDWFVDTSGLGFLLKILSGPKIILSAIGLPEALAWAITAFWYGITLFIIIAFIWGR